MFTSRAEHRLVLRQDNADLRLTPIARECGMIDSSRWTAFTKRTADFDRLRKFAETADIDGTKLNSWLRRPENSITKLPLSLLSNFASDVCEAFETDLKYEGYIVRQNIAIERLRRQEDKKLPAQIDYLSIHGLRVEARHKLAATRPETLGQASRISGVTPADLALLAVWMERTKSKA